MVVSAFPGPSTLDTLGMAALYAVVIGFVLIECGLLVGFLLPGDTLLFAAGLVAADAGHGANVVWLAAGVFLAAVLGECIGYLFGARTGIALLRRRSGRVINPGNLERAERFTARYGVLAIIAARWVPWVRTFAPVLAGATRMPWARFMMANVLGALAWAPTLILLGYAAASVPALKHISIALATGMVTLAVVIGAVGRWRAARRAGATPEPAHAVAVRHQPGPPDR